jgi:alginate O-acetyltransferase complex protein AlgJ
MRRALDLLLGLVAILVPALLLLADQVASAVPPYNHIKITPGLVGVTLPIDPAPTPARVLDGAWQADYARMIGTRTPLYPFAVRLKDQILFSVFGLSGIPALVVGRGGALMEREYLDEYCSRNLAAFAPLARAWAPMLRQMQDAYESRGKTFLYVITPSKVAQYPGLIPAGFPCPATPADRAGLLPLWRQVLEAAGVHTVDTTIPIFAAHGQYPFAMYPRGGTHWNSVGAAIATRAIAEGLDRLRGDTLLPPPDFTWTMAPRPIWPDDDLASLMNLLVADRSYAVPRAVLSAPPPPGGCRTLSVAIVGGSFMNRPAEDLALGPCAPHVEEWQYWTVFDITWPPGTDGKASVDPVTRDAKLLAADVVIYEENEQVVARSTHGPAFYAFLQRAWGFAPHPSRGQLPSARP